ncbi:DUF6732 family protein [Marivivens donghaensis]|jgi:hypothetical protein|uniref:DUF6732 family protein n=1 Tax=Marivivens donghaensis TaxID=1699413 RepID=UPI003F699AA9
MRSALTLILLLTANAASAHVGHLGEMAGHDHWVAGAALGLAILLGLREALKARKENAEKASKETEEETEEEVEGEEVPA